jgi:DNA (cytosine-5)-methyltransferase 1
VFGPARAVAWRVLDAQYFGLAQRRKRVFVVASARDDFDPAQVLLEFDGVRRDSAPSREAGERVASRAGSGVAFGGNRTSGPIDVTPALLAQPGSGWKGDFESETFVTTAHTLRGEGFDASEDGTGRGTPLVPVAFQVGPASGEFTDVAPTMDCRAKNGPIQNQLGVGVLVHSRAVAGTITSNYGKQLDNSDTALGPNVVAFHPTQDPISSTDGSTHAMGCGSSQGCATVAVAFADTAPSIVQGTGGGAGHLYRQKGNETAVVGAALQVRRLTPRECERLQGFPDDYTLIAWRKKPASECPDGPRYKALGNSWAVPVVRWIGARISNHLNAIA